MVMEFILKSESNESQTYFPWWKKRVITNKNKNTIDQKYN